MASHYTDNELLWLWFSEVSSPAILPLDAMVSSFTAHRLVLYLMLFL